MYTQSCTLYVDICNPGLGGCICANTASYRFECEVVLGVGERCGLQKLETGEHPSFWSIRVAQVNAKKMQIPQNEQGGPGVYR